MHGPMNVKFTLDSLRKIFSPTSHPGLCCLLNHPSKLVISRNLRTWTLTNETRLFSEVQTQRIVLDIIHSFMYDLYEYKISLFIMLPHIHSGLQTNLVMLTVQWI